MTPIDGYADAVARWSGGPPGDRRTALRDLVDLAGADPELRQPVVDAICGYLRTPVVVAGDGVPGGDAVPGGGGAVSGGGDVVPSGGDAGAAADEPALRRAALGLLADRLRPSADGAPGWAGITLDLSGATLVDVDLSGCHLTVGRFADTRFVGPAAFAGTRFDGDGVFSRAVFGGPARFPGVRFGADAAFGRVRFRGPVDFAGATFGAIAWFGRGEEELWEDDEAWETVEEIDPAPWDEPNEDDPRWPVAVVMGDYQEWTEGGIGARFGGDVSFRRARFTGPAWFWKAQFAAAADFTGTWFAAGVHLDPPAADLTGARWSGTADDGEMTWPLGWTAVAGADGECRLTPDEPVRRHAGQLAAADPRLAAAGLAALAALGDARPELRQPVADALCAWLRRPVPVPLTDPTGTAVEVADREVRLRRVAARLLTDRLRPAAAGGPAESTADAPVDPTVGVSVAPTVGAVDGAAGPDPATRPPYWPETDLWLCGAVLVDVDLSGCRVRYADFTGTQFHGVTRFDGSDFEAAQFTLGGPDGRATFHGPVTFTDARFGGRREPGRAPDGVVCHAPAD
ncbi:pentapeptide repeat-containing protein [Micromonospora rosaria]|uniref:pentapeptide repeat-containing protein n=2 Tax=Micromonospora rosaria TaxID=47874 RepID=UPI0037C7B5C3